ncbi:cob(I)yrinic acid a,c-diamide adenosyltransferase [Candidatus Woesearchaeota archaeon]|nr:MAG: cob(I)yrinic acid a,c-diamide adenosyltransferase [Candidatus Woesearchaeota archaeon]
MSKKALIYLWTGHGYGKSTSAFGTALRAIGQGKRVICIEFMKGRTYTGEYKFSKKHKNFEMYLFGRPGWVNLKKPSKADKKRAKHGLEFARNIYKKKKPFLLILDEINLACKIGLLKTKDVIDFLDEITTPTRVYITGREAPASLKKRADYVNIIINTKKKKVPASKGIEY